LQLPLFKRNISFRFMRYLLVFLFLFSSIIVSGQDVKLNYSKGSSQLFFDLESKSKLSDRVSLSYSLKNSVFELGYLHSSFSYDKPVVDQSQLLENYQSTIDNLFVAYSNKVTTYKTYSFYVGLEFGYSQFNNYTNLVNNRGLNYSDYSFSEWGALGYYAESNFETSLSDFNIDQLEDYQTNYFSFGPSLECSFKLVDRIEVSIKSVYRKNTTDLIDNVDVYNQRGISAKTNSDDHLDLFVGLKFNFNSNKTFSTFSAEMIDSIVKDVDLQEDVVVQAQAQAVPDNSEAIITQEEYILSYFDLDSLEASSKEYMTQVSQPDITVSQADVVSQNEPEQEFIVEESIVDQSNNEETYFVIVGVFSNMDNLKKMSESKGLNSQDSFLKNDLYYLYILKTNSIDEARQLRTSTDIDCWILKK